MAVVVGLDVGGTKTNATVLTDDGRFLVDHMVEMPSRVLEGPRRRSRRSTRRWSWCSHDGYDLAHRCGPSGSTRPGRPAPMA